MYRYLAILLVAFVGLAGFDKKEVKEFTVVFIPPQGESFSNFYLDFMTDKMVRDSSTLQDGKVSFKGEIEHPTKGRILLITTDKDGKKMGQPVDVILESSNIIVDASKGVSEVTYSGNKTQQEFNQWRAGLAPVYKEIQSKWTEVDKLNKAGDKEAEKRVREEIQMLAKKAQSVKEDFLAKNNNSLITALMLKDYTTVVWENLENAEKYYNNLSPQLKELPDMKKFAKELAVAMTMAPGKKYPEFTLPDSTGKMVNLSSFKGKYVLVDFWASWCGPCRAESPALVAAFKKYQPKGFDIVSVSIDENTKAWLKAVTKDQYTWSNVVDSTQNLAKNLNINAIPRNFLLDKDGKVIATNLRGEALEKKLVEVFGS